LALQFKLPLLEPLHARRFNRKQVTDLRAEIPDRTPITRLEAIAQSPKSEPLHCTNKLTVESLRFVEAPSPVILAEDMQGQGLCSSALDLLLGMYHQLATEASSTGIRVYHDGLEVRAGSMAEQFFSHRDQHKADDLRNLVEGLGHIDKRLRSFAHQDRL
jgi:hypothetical protein